MTHTTDYLASAYHLSRSTRTYVVDACTPREWFALVDAYLACGWDLTPCLWTPEQRIAAIDHGIVPEWSDDVRAFAPKKCAGFYVDANTGEFTSCKACNPNHNKPVMTPLFERMKQVSAIGMNQSPGWRLVELDDGRVVVLPHSLKPEGGDLTVYQDAAKVLTKLVGLSITVRRWAP